MVMVTIPNSLDSISQLNLLLVVVMVRPMREDRAAVVDTVVERVVLEPRGKDTMAVLAFIALPVIHQVEEVAPVEEAATQVVAAPRVLVELDLITT